MLRLPAFVMLVAVAGCGTKQIDACADVPAGACLTLEITGAHGVVDVDKLIIDASGAIGGERSSAFAGSEALPVRVGVVPPLGAAGDVTFTVTGLNNGITVGAGGASHTLVANDRATIDIELLSQVSDQGVQLDAADLANADAFNCTPEDIVGCSQDGTSLLTCNASGGGTTSATCALDCAPNPKPHCKQFLPHLPATQPMLANAGAGMITISTNTIIDTDTGTIGGVAMAGVTYQQLTTSGVFTLTDLTIDDGAVMTVIGSRSLVIVAKDTIVLQGTIDARPYHSNGATPPVYVVCSASAAGPGGGAGGVEGTNAGSGVDPSGPTGTGGGHGGNGAMYGAAGGGGGNADKGGSGGNGNLQGNVQTALGGGTLVAPQFPIIGGAGGGAGTSAGSTGGGGGGAVHLVAGNTIQIGGQPGSMAPQGIDVSGCGGAGGVSNYAPGGGGAGGTILVEAPTFKFESYGVLIANGGGGGGGVGNNGGVSPFSGAVAAGGAASATYAAGGAGGATTKIVGVVGMPGTGSSSPPLSQCGGGGGGAAGRIAIFDGDDSIDLNVGAVVTPQFNTMSSGASPITACYVATINTD